MDDLYAQDLSTATHNHNISQSIPNLHNWKRRARLTQPQSSLIIEVISPKLDEGHDNMEISIGSKRSRERITTLNDSKRVHLSNFDLLRVEKANPNWLHKAQ